MMIEIRKVHPHQSSQVRNLVASIMASEFPNHQDTFPMDDLDHLADAYGSLGETFLVAMDGDRIVGTIGVKKEDERTALLRRFFVEPTCRNQGIGSRLLQQAIDFCRQVGYQEIVVKTTSGMKQAMDLCRKVGFQERGHVGLGPLQLYRFAYFIKENSPLSRAVS